MKEHERRTPVSQPTAERTADQSTQSASGLTAERPGVTPERQSEDDRDVVVRTQRPDERTPRNYDSDDDVMPSDDSSLNTKI